PMTTPVHVVCHEAVHQLTHHFTKGSAPGKRDLVTPSYWFQEGFAEYMSPASDSPTGKDPQTGAPTYDFEGILRGRLMEYTSNVSLKLTLPLDQLIRDDQGQAVQHLIETLKNQNVSNEMKVEAASIAFYGQAWFFVHFLNHYEKGKYRAPFDQYVAAELNVDSNPQSGLMLQFRKAFGIGKWDDEKLTTMAKEMEDYLGQL